MYNFYSILSVSDPDKLQIKAVIIWLLKFFQTH